MKTTQLQLTELEKKVMINIAESEYIDVETLDGLVDYPTWSFVATDETKELAGALGSLVKKGLVVCGSDVGDKGKKLETCWLTKDGVEHLKNFYCYR
jgi:hypothetical protein